VRIRHVEKAPPPIGASPKIVAPKSGRCQIYVLKPWRNQGECQHQATHLSSLEIMAARDLDNLGPACTAENADVGKVKPSCIDVHKQGGALPVAGAAPALAEGTAGVRPAGEAETASTARPEALVPWAKDKVVRGHERCHQRVSANMARCHNTAQTRTIASPVGHRKSRRTRPSCPLGRDKTPGILEETRPEMIPSSRKLRPWTSHRASTPHNKRSHQASSPTRKTLAVQKSSQSASTILRSQPCTWTHPSSSHPTVEESIRFSS